MPDDYAYPIAQCDVTTGKRAALQSYRDKRRLWLSWIDTDEHHAIWRALSSMVWTDVSLRALTHFAFNDENNGLNNSLLAEALLDGHVATQVLAIRRLMDDGNSDIISLRRLVKDLRRNFALLTRENYVCFDGLPYDYEAVRQKEMMDRAGKGFFWGRNVRPGRARHLAQAHEQFDNWPASTPRSEAAKTAFPPLSLQPLKGGLTTAARTNWQNGATPFLLTRAARNRGKELPT